MLGQTIFQTVVAVAAAMISTSIALAYFRRVRLPRPAVGVFHGRDVVTLLGMITVLPLLYLAVPAHVLTGFLVVTFVCALSIGLRPLLRKRWIVPLVAGLLAGNVVVSYTLLGTNAGFQLYWASTSTVVLLAVVSISNLYVQGGLRVVHVARFGLALAVYDLVFALVIPITPLLADAFEGQPLSPSMGYAIAPYRANIGMGDLLVYCLFVLTVFKGFGRSAVTKAFGAVLVFGAVLPSLAPTAVSLFDLEGSGIVVPAQVFFGPAAYVLYRALIRRSREQTMGQWTTLRDDNDLSEPISPQPSSSTAGDAVLARG